MSQKVFINFPACKHILLGCRAAEIVSVREVIIHWFALLGKTFLEKGGPQSTRYGCMTGAPVQEQGIIGAPLSP